MVQPLWKRVLWSLTKLKLHLPNNPATVLLNITSEKWKTFVHTNVKWKSLSRVWLFVTPQTTHIKKQRHYFANKGPSSQSYGFSSSHVWMWELDYKASWVLKNWCFWTVMLEETLEIPLDCKEIQPVHPKGDQSWIFRKDLCWSWNSNTLATWCEELTHLKRPWCWERLKAGGEGDDRGWMASLTQWTWVWVNSGIWWWTGSPGVLQSMGSQRVRHDWATSLSLSTFCIW